jgi:hypothetical protein
MYERGIPSGWSFSGPLSLIVDDIKARYQKIVYPNRIILEE